MWLNSSILQAKVKLMRIVNRILIVLFVVGLFSSCTQRKYGHVTGFQLNNKTKTEKTTHSGHFVKQEKPTTNIASDATVDVSNTLNSETFEFSKETKKIDLKRFISALKVQCVEENESSVVPEVPAFVKVQQVVAPKNVFNKVKTEVGKKTKAGGLIYWILVLILLLLIVALLESILGKNLTRLLILVLLLAFVGHLLGLW
ncbi:MAG: hypothetical protein ACI8SE_001316 [Bacteroidia bacterium]